MRSLFIFGIVFVLIGSCFGSQETDIENCLLPTRDAAVAFILTEMGRCFETLSTPKNPLNYQCLMAIKANVNTLIDGGVECLKRLSLPGISDQFLSDTDEECHDIMMSQVVPILHKCNVPKTVRIFFVNKFDFTL
jgi:hypothetical protein